MGRIPAVSRRAGTVQLVFDDPTQDRISTRDDGPAAALDQPGQPRPASTFRALVDAQCATLGLSRSALASRAQVGRSTLFAWLAGSADPSAPSWQMLADALDVSVERLLSARRGSTVSKVEAARLSAGLTRRALAASAHVAVGTVTSLERGGRVRADAAARICRALKLPIGVVCSSATPTDTGHDLAATLEAVRRSRGWTLTELGRRLGVSRQCVSAWLAGRASVPAEKLAAIAALLGVLPDMLPAAVTLPKPRPGKQFGDTLRAARRAAGWSQRDLATALGMSRSSVESWERGARLPSPPARARLDEILTLSPALASAA